MKMGLKLNMDSHEANQDVGYSDGELMDWEEFGELGGILRYGMRMKRQMECEVNRG